MKVLWLCNTMLPQIAKCRGESCSNKEGWLSGILDAVTFGEEADIELEIAFPMAVKQFPSHAGEVLTGTAAINDHNVCYYIFPEDLEKLHLRQENLESCMKEILERSQPDVIHCFGTEYPHTRSMCECAPDKKKLLVGIQGLCAVYANAYLGDLPERVIHSATLRDRIKHDSIPQQREKFARRGENEIAAVRLAGNIAGRTDWDWHYTNEWNPNAAYYHLNENLRSSFYEAKWDPDGCKPHRIMISQGNYPVKGLHYMLLALPLIRAKYPDASVAVAGDCITGYSTWREKLKLSAYGRYLRELIAKGGIEDSVTFLGSLSEEQMVGQYLQSQLYVNCSTIENSPNSLGEAMLLGMPCVSARVGGVESVFWDGADGICYEGFYSPENSFDRNYIRNLSDYEKSSSLRLRRQAESLAEAVLRMWENGKRMLEFGKNARSHAQVTHDREANYQKLLEIYRSIA